MVKRVKKIRGAEITGENCKQKLFEYAMRHYSQDMEAASQECPYGIEGLSPEFALKEVAEWFISERSHPALGKTIVREFVEKHEDDMELGLKEKLLQLEEMFYGEFEVIAMDDTHLILEDLNSGEWYTVKLFFEDRGAYKVGRIVRGRIHPWGDVHRFAGIVHIRPSEEEIARQMGLITPGMVGELMERYEKEMIRKAESIIINPKTKLASVLNKYPSQWVDGICKALGIPVKGQKKEKMRMIVENLQSGEIQSILEKLPPQCREALKFVVGKGGWVKYSQLASRFDDEITYGWDEDPPVSTIGIIRLHALLSVGKMGIGGRMYKVAVVPFELREEIGKCIS